MAAPGLRNDEPDVVRGLEELVMALEHEHLTLDTADVELLALSLQAIFAMPDVPAELARELPAVLARRGDGVAADLLVALERLAPEPLAGFAAERRARLEQAGIVAPHARLIGAASLDEASVLPAPADATEIWHCVLRRPESEVRQTIVVFVQHEPCGAVIVDLVAAEPEDGPDPEALLRHGGDRSAERLGTRELLERLRDALAHMARHDVPLDSEAARALPLLERALTGSVGRLPRPEVAYGDEDDELQEWADVLVEAFADALEQDEDAGAALREHGPYVAHCMLDWKLGSADRYLESWTLGDLRELLLDWFPRKVTADGQTIEIAADAVKRFLRFLADKGLLDAPVPVASLEAAVERLRPRFERACCDPRLWDPAKSLVAGMTADGVDLGDQHAVDAWIEDYNARALAGRTEAPARPPAAKRAKRKAVRQARRRNRR